MGVYTHYIRILANSQIFLDGIAGSVWIVLFLSSFDYFSEKYATTESERTEGEEQRHSTSTGICLPGTASGKRLPISEISVFEFQ